MWFIYFASASAAVFPTLHPAARMEKLVTAFIILFFFPSVLLVVSLTVSAIFTLKRGEKERLKIPPAA